MSRVKMDIAEEAAEEFRKRTDPIESLTDAEKRALALKLLGETDSDALKAVHLAEQEKETQTKIDNSLKDEETKQRNEPHYWIEINRMGPDDSETHVFVGAAGVSYWIQKDVPVPVPKSVLDVLDCAIINGTVSVTDDVLGVKYAKKVKYKRYPYSRIGYGEVSKEELAAFRAEQDEKRKAGEDAVIGQEMARAQIVKDSIARQEEPFVPAYLKEQTSEDV